MNFKHAFTKSTPVLVFLLIFAVLIGGCARESKNVKKDPSFDKWRVKAEKSKAYAPSPRQHAARAAETRTRTNFTPKVRVAEAAPEIQAENLLPTNKISLRMHDIELSVLLRALAKAANQNIMINEKVTGKANISIAEAPWNEVFLGILRTHGLTYAWEGNIIRIMTIEDMEQDLKRASQKKGFRLVTPQIVQVVKINYSEAKKLQENLENFLSKNDDGKPIGSVMVDEHTNSIIIQAIPDDVDRIIALIDELDRPTPQVLIEAHIVEANQEVARELGVQWGGLSHNGFRITPGARSAGVFGNTLDAGINPTSGIASNFPAPGVTDALGLTIGFAVEDIGNSIISAQLSALQQEGKLNILSSPSITTLDNQKAIIESGTQVPYQTVEDGEVKIEYKDAVLSLEVTPNVIDGETLKLNIFTKKDELDFTNAVQGQPAINTKRAETRVLLFDGQTTVIGGLTKETNARAEAGVPALKDIPLLGWLFRSEDREDQKEDLLIFITPHILKEKVGGSDRMNAVEQPSPAEAPPVPEATPQ